ncbi:hypothetical protein A5893_13840 [Pedobacter psychrophilus]|uniref:Uncharacterized protein n=1 Tax=Pedobacter psychrophilus TaxID=1826909 RepID=A0A179DCJ8_9SPHI|nr:hypothetical protein [Pedobacter psychrophilus]OAQ38502.1 hypothetical protein A5893_13840 [Pedobacter psychrophilus]
MSRIPLPKLEDNPFVNRKKVTFKLNNKIIEGFITAVPYELAKVEVGYYIELDEIKLVICSSIDGWVQLNRKSDLVESIGNYIEKYSEEIETDEMNIKQQQSLINKQRSDELIKHYEKVIKKTKIADISI